MIRIGVAGQGFGLHLLHTLLNRADCRVVAVSDHFDERLAFARSRGIEVFASDVEMIATCDLDAVALASAPHVRGAGLAAALDKGVPVFMEKPLAGTVAQAEALVRQCEGRRVMQAFSFRFHAPVRRLLAELAGPLGAPRVLNAEYLFDWLPAADGWLWDPERGGGFFNENSCHLFDVVTRVMGEVDTVFAAPFDDGSRPSATAAAVTIRFSNGAVGALTIGGQGTGAFDDYPRLDVACADGQARMAGRNHMWTELRWAERGGDIQCLRAEPEALGRTRYSDAFDHFFASLADELPFAATPADGLRAVRLADAVYRSIRSGQAETV